MIDEDFEALKPEAPKYASTEFKHMIGEFVDDTIKREGVEFTKGVIEGITGEQFIKLPGLLSNKEIVQVIHKEFDKFIVGEEETRKAIFICACGVFVKNLSATFNVLVNGESSAGKSWITKNVLKLLPERCFNKQTYRTRISPKVLTYWHNYQVEPTWTWDGKCLYLEDIGNDILNSDVFKVMTSEGSTATIVGKSKNKDVELPTAIDIEIIGKPITFITTAVGTPIEEIKNRFLMIDLDESAEQTDKIMQRQLEMAVSGKSAVYDPVIKDSLNHLERVEVLLPDWIMRIKDFMPRKDVLRWRREFPRFLEIIKCSAALHQYQRKTTPEGQVIASEQDYEVARGVIGKITASSGVEGLTRREKMAYSYVKEYFKAKDKGCTRSEIHAFRPIYTDRQWETHLDNLAAKSLLTVQIEVNPDTNRKVSYYYPNELKNLSLPDIITLMEVMEVIRIPINNERSGLLENENDVHVKNDEITSITSTSIMIAKDGGITPLYLEAGHKYPKSYFGDDADQIIEMLEKEGKVKM